MCLFFILVVSIDSAINFRVRLEVFFNRGSAESEGSVSGYQGFRWNRPKLPGTKFQPHICAVEAIPPFHSILATMNRIETSVYPLLW